MNPHDIVPRLTLSKKEREFVEAVRDDADRYTNPGAFLRGVGDYIDAVRTRGQHPLRDYLLRDEFRTPLHALGYNDAESYSAALRMCIDHAGESPQMNWRSVRLELRERGLKV